MFTPSPSRQAHKLAIVSLILTKKPGDVVTKKDISEATKVVESEWKGSIDDARKVLREEHRIELAPVRGIGYQIARPGDIAGIVASDLRSVHRKARRARDKAGTVDKNKFLSMSDDERQQFILQKARAEIACDTTAPKRLRDLAVVNRKELPSIAGLDD